MRRPAPLPTVLLALLAMGSAALAEPAADRATAAAILAEAPADGLPAVDPGEMSDASLRTAAVAYVSAQYGRLRPSQVNREWALDFPRPDPEAGYAAAASSDAVSQWLTEAAPRDPRYRALLAQRRTYAGFAAAGGWPVLTAESVAAGAALRERLTAEGYAIPAEAAPNAALILFQRRHGLAADGKVGPATLAALNVSAADRLLQIDANLERWRWLPRDLPADRVEVDVAGARLTLFAAGQPVLRMKVIVGTPVHHTPLFASALRAVVFNPPWIVPDSIARNELWPVERAHPGSLAAAGIIEVDGRLMQPPGPRNPLGAVKFDFDSPFGVFLHDTSAPGLFANSRRLFSHGCIRIEKPRDLALQLLKAQGWSKEKIEAAIAARTTRRVGLTTQTPLFVLYWTAGVGRDGAARFRPDVYGWDAQLIGALRRLPERRARD